MDTSKDYYESVMRDFQTYGRGRTLEHYCRDEAVDFSHRLTMLDLNTAQFSKIATTHTITRSQLALLLTGAVVRTIKINLDGSTGIPQIVQGSDGDTDIHAMMPNVITLPDRSQNTSAA